MYSALLMLDEIVHFFLPEEIIASLHFRLGSSSVEMWGGNEQHPMPSHTAHRKRINTATVHFIRYLDYSIIIILFYSINNKF